MAKKKEEAPKELTQAEQSKQFDALFAIADKSNEYASTLDDDSLASVDKWLSTGFHALNGIISTDLYKGIPCGRVTTLFGPSQSGKSLLSALIQKAAQKEGMRVILFDSEFDKDGRMEASFGVDTTLVKTMPVETVEDLIKQASKLYDTIIDNKGLHGKVLVVIDSLGALSTDKEVRDINENKVTMDMGLKAKLVKTLFKKLASRSALSKCPCLVINHEIANPGKQYESIFKDQGGGQAIEFFSSVMIHIGKTKLKEDVKNDFDVETMFTKAKTTGQNLNLFTQKNRYAMPHKQVECYLNYQNGIDPYSGLKPLLDELECLYLKSAKGEIGTGRTWYIKIDGEEVKLGEWNQWKNDAEIWDTHILPELNKITGKLLGFEKHG
tara:strand:- start:58954 stop:60099 length:1146 start_codon:yes stop_codon:yes gene_type:complete